MTERCEYHSHSVRYVRAEGVDTVTVYGRSYLPTVGLTDAEVCLAASERVRDDRYVPQHLVSALVAEHCGPLFGSVWLGKGWTVEVTGRIFRTTS